MLRRDLLRLLGGVSALAAIPTEDLFALGESTHAGLRANTAGLGFFDAHQLQTVAAAADRIIPTTETPGAREADCHRFAEKIIADHYDTTRQKRFITGLVDLDSRSSTLAQKLFVDLTPQQQDSVLAAVEKDTLASATPAAPSGATSSTSPSTATTPRASGSRTSSR
ncbi:MAG: gluconate 2-dehydrogenase subunit 3 family protein [Gemmatimonadetes bacterium]|nr:gluconate 2-dehydrogenase subunit 3 family protein [Gemmatimonadota bacterium]